jgi:hypothetical protein
MQTALHTRAHAHMRAYCSAHTPRKHVTAAPHTHTHSHTRAHTHTHLLYRSLLCLAPLLLALGAPPLLLGRAPLLLQLLHLGRVACACRA